MNYGWFKGLTKTQQRNFKKLKKASLPKPIPVFKWDAAKERAAVLFATEENITNEAVSKAIDVNVRTIYKWQLRSEFKARVTEHFELWKKSMRDKSLAVKERRLVRYIDRCDRIQRVIEQRAQEYSQLGLGGDTGLIVKEEKTVAGEKVAHYVFDRAIITEERELMKQIAIELGQWENKLEVTGADGGPIDMQITGPDGNPLRELGPETLMEILLLIKNRAAGNEPKTIDVPAKQISE